MSLQSGFDGHFGRLVLHLLALGWCSFVPLAGVLLVDWNWPVRQSVFEPGECKDRPRCSTNKQHAFGVILKGIEDLFVDLGSGHELHFGFFFSLWAMEKTHSAATLVGNGDGCWMLL